MMYELLIPLGPFLLFFILVIMWGQATAKNCPKCDAELTRRQPILARTRRQWSHGSLRCGVCQALVDPDGSVYSETKDEAVPAPGIAYTILGATCLLSAIAAGLSWVLFARL